MTRRRCSTPGTTPRRGASLCSSSPTLPPPRWKVALPDLRSRLAATPHVEIGPPDDALLGQLILKLLGDRGIAAPPELGDFLVPRIERSYVSVLMIVNILDRVMLSHHRRMTVPLAKRALEEAGMIGRARKSS